MILEVITNARVAVYTKHGSKRFTYVDSVFTIIL